MRIDVVMPKMGESLQEGTILKWLKNKGDKIERDEMILEISTDKVDTEVPAPAAGILSEILAEENEVVEVGSVIAIIETDAGSASVPPSQVAAEPVEKQQSPQIEVKVPPVAAENSNSPADLSEDLVDVVMPKMGESLQEGTILKWLKDKGDKIERDEMILEISTDKVDTEVPSPVAGILADILAEEGDTVEVGSVIAKIAVASSKNSSVSANAETDAVHKTVVDNVADTQPKAQPGTIEIPRSDGKNFYSPLVRSIAKAEGITLEELQSLKGSGADGRLAKKDIMEYLKTRRAGKPISSPPQKPAAPSSIPEKPPIQAPSPAVSIPSGPDVDIIPMDRVRQLIAEHMVYSKRTSAHVTSVAECDVTDLVKFREKFKNDFFDREGIKLTYTPFFAKALVEAVKDFPMINVSVDGRNIVHHKRTHLSFATALDDGNLIVPVIKNADSLSVSGLARSVYDLATRARTKKLNPDEIQGGTITLTNVGTFGTMFGTPVINQPQCAIIGVGAIKKQPVVREFNGEDVIVVRHIMYVSITYDHRVIDGMLAGQALAQIVKHLEAMNENTLSL